MQGQRYESVWDALVNLSTHANMRVEFTVKEPDDTTPA